VTGFELQVLQVHGNLSYLKKQSKSYMDQTKNNNLKEDKTMD